MFFCTILILITVSSIYSFIRNLPLAAKGLIVSVSGVSCSQGSVCCSLRSCLAAEQQEADVPPEAEHKSYICYKE